VQGDVSGYRERLVQSVAAQGIELNYSERIGPAKGLSHGGKIILLLGMQPAEEFSTLVHEIGHLCGVGIYVALASGCAERRAVTLDQTPHKLAPSDTEQHYGTEFSASGSPTVRRDPLITTSLVTQSLHHGKQQQCRAPRVVESVGLGRKASSGQIA
jgi:hypothetical protein